MDLVSNIGRALAAVATGFCTTGRCRWHAWRAWHSKRERWREGSEGGQCICIAYGPSGPKPWDSRPKLDTIACTLPYLLTANDHHAHHHRFPLLRVARKFLDNDLRSNVSWA